MRQIPLFYNFKMDEVKRGQVLAETNIKKDNKEYRSNRSKRGHITRKTWKKNI